MDSTNEDLRVNSKLKGAATTGLGNTIIIPVSSGNVAAAGGGSGFTNMMNGLFGKMGQGFGMQGASFSDVNNSGALQGMGTAMIGGLDQMLSHGKGFDDAGAANQAMNGFFDTASDVMMKIPGAQGYGMALKAADFIGDGLAKLGVTNSGMTTMDQFTQNGVGNLIGGVLLGNNIFTKKTDDFKIDEQTREDMGGSYSGSYSLMDKAEDLAGKRYGWMSGNAYKHAQSKIRRANTQQDTIKTIDEMNQELNDMVTYGGDVARYRYLSDLAGGYNQAAMHVENGGKVEVMEVDDNAEGPLPFAGGISGYAPMVIEIVEDMDEGGGESMLGRGQERPGAEALTGKIGREVASARDEVLKNYVPEVVKQVIPEVYDDFAQVAEAAGGKEFKDEVLDKYVPDVVDRVVPEVIERSSEAAERGAFEMKRSLVKKMTGRDIADLYDGNATDAFYDSVCEAVGMDFDRPQMQDMPDMMDEVMRYVDGIMRSFSDAIPRGGRGVSYSSGMSRTETTRDVPGIGPVTVVRQTRERPRVEYFGPSYKAGGSVKARERIERQLDAPQVGESSQMNTIPEGALHKERHRMDLEGDCTKKGIPVLDMDSNEQEAEIERNEIIFNKEVTRALEDLYEIYYSPDSDDETRDNAAVEAGKLLTREIMLNTDDRTGLIDTLKKGGRMQEGGQVRYDPLSTRKRHLGLDSLVEYAESENPRFVQRLGEFPGIVGFDTGDGNGTVYGTHYLGWEWGPEYVDENDTGPAYVFPQIMEDKEGSGRLVFWPSVRSAMDEAIRRGDYLKMNPADAEWFTEHYKEHYNQYMKDFDEMERYMRSHPDADPVMVAKYFRQMSEEKNVGKRKTR